MCLIHVGQTSVTAAWGQEAEAASEPQTNEVGVGMGGGTCTVVPRDEAVRGYGELTVTGVEKVMIRGAWRHAPNDVALRVERAERTGTA